MTPQEIQGAILGGGQHSGTLGGGGQLCWEQAVAGCLCTGWVTAALWVGTLAMTEGIRMTPPGGRHHWVAQVALGGSQQPLAQLVAPRSGPQPCRSPSSRNHRSRQTLAGSPLNVTNRV